MKMKATQEEMVAGIQAYALKNYEKGWDWIVECCEPNDIAKFKGE